MQAALLRALDDNPNATDQLRLLWVASRGICWRCKDPVKLSQASNDHVIPRVRGGTDHPRNLRLAHRRCNSDASDAMPTEPPPRIPMEGLQPYHGSKSALRTSITWVVRRDGNLCWLCLQPVLLHEATRSRVRMEYGYSFGPKNVRLAHGTCQIKRITAKNAWATRLARSRRRGASQRLTHRRRVVVLRRRHAAPVRPTWLQRIRVIVCRIFRLSRPGGHA